ncbi:hypothetical protein IB238_10860 [Rhizobium sp. ARZ01]|uniref:hypothetical protein n=1 Tax=Rhizobium sp. ARZ01 TaxID=2769313 RepID=UPI00178116AC|nr:hypothetical protein [Rhizobium sp. ARZ01]MBD9373119.1 hypothetical protein [Rhizobium sp. ARZ01]
MRITVAHRGGDAREVFNFWIPSRRKLRGRCYKYGLNESSLKMTFKVKFTRVVEKQAAAARLSPAKTARASTVAVFRQADAERQASRTRGGPFA